MSYLIEATNLHKRMGNFLLQDISFTLEPGYIMGFVGSNGAGKSTTIKLLLNIMKRQSGEVRLFGLDNIKDEIQIKQQIGFVIEGTQFHEMMTVSQVVWLVSSFYKQWDAAVFSKLAKRYDLPMKKKIKELSTGTKAKLSVAIALSHHARLLILDEPTSGLDPVVRDDILKDLRDVVKDQSCGVFFSTHITSDLDKIADYLTFIQNGRIILSATKDEIDEKYAIVKGAKKNFDDIKSYILRFVKTDLGFAALTQEAAFIRKTFPWAVIEKSSVEDVLIYHEKGEAIC